MSQILQEPPRQTPVIHECDVCVIGGSCTGVFAAVRAARLGARVVLVEKAGAFGGVATLSLVNVWHSPLDAAFEKPIIGGLTIELIDRLRARNAVEEYPRSTSVGWTFNPYEMMVELDRLVLEHDITAMLHTTMVAAHVTDGRLEAVLVENKSGRQAIRARFFIDASGDGDLAERAGVPCYAASYPQPSTTCAIFEGWDTLGDQSLNDLVGRYGADYDLPRGFIWGKKLPGSDLYMLAGTRVAGLDPSNAADLTRSEIEGRRQVSAIQQLIRDHVPQANVRLVGLPARIGLRESRHVHCAYQVKGDDVLYGRPFEDAIANGSYRVDIHHPDKPGITLRYLDGTETYSGPGLPPQQGRWREPMAQDPTFYQIPYRSLVPPTFPNLLVAGRIIDMDPVAHAALRVMVNANQTGEAAGVAAVLAGRTTDDVRKIDVAALRRELAAGGSIML